MSLSSSRTPFHSGFYLWGPEPGQGQAGGVPLSGVNPFPREEVVAAWGFQVCVARRQWGSGCVPGEGLSVGAAGTC